MSTIRFRRDRAGRAWKGTPLRWLRAAIKRDTDECVLWPFGTDAYGSLRIGSVTRAASAWACEWAHGPAPAGAESCHSCNTPRCVNPRHLRWDTVAGNAADRVMAGSSKGERNPKAKLTKEQAAEIRRRYAAGGVSQRALGEEFGVRQEMIGFIVRGQNWRVDY